MEIRESLCTTINSERQIHHAAMGVVHQEGQWVIRPYPETRTLANLTQRAAADAWLSFVDDALPLVLAALGLGEMLITRSDASGLRWVDGAVSVAHVRVAGVTAPEAPGRPYALTLAVLEERVLRPYHGVSRAYGALLEAAVAATRIPWLGRRATEEALERARPLLEKTGSAKDWRAYEIIRARAEAPENGGAG
ncbi:MAG: DUF447 family protein [Firmicutes bacterium]|nr:DUF447 family protein [Bacillota bacterium]